MKAQLCRQRRGQWRRWGRQQHSLSDRVAPTGRTSDLSASACCQCQGDQAHQHRVRGHGNFCRRALAPQSATACSASGQTAEDVVRGGSGRDQPHAEARSCPPGSAACRAAPHAVHPSAGAPSALQWACHIKQCEC